MGIARLFIKLNNHYLFSFPPTLLSLSTFPSCHVLGALEVSLPFFHPPLLPCLFWLSSNLSPLLTTSLYFPVSSNFPPLLFPSLYFPFSLTRSLQIYLPFIFPLFKQISLILSLEGFSFGLHPCMHARTHTNTNKTKKTPNN